MRNWVAFGNGMHLAAVQFNQFPVISPALGALGSPNPDEGDDCVGRRIPTRVYMGQVETRKV